MSIIWLSLGAAASLLFRFCSAICSHFSSLEFYASVVSYSRSTENTKSGETGHLYLRSSQNQQDLWWDKQPAFSACSFSLLPSFSPAHTWLTTSNPQTTNVRKNPKKVNFETDVIKDFRQPEYGGNWSLNRNNVCFFSVFNTCHGSSPLFSWFSNHSFFQGPRKRSHQIVEQNRPCEFLIWKVYHVDVISFFCRWYLEKTPALSKFPSTDTSPLW